MTIGFTHFEVTDDLQEHGVSGVVMVREKVIQDKNRKS